MIHWNHTMTVSQNRTAAGEAQEIIIIKKLCRRSNSNIHTRAHTCFMSFSFERCEFDSPIRKPKRRLCTHSRIKTANVPVVKDGVAIRVTKAMKVSWSRTITTRFHNAIRNGRKSKTPPMPL